MNAGGGAACGRLGGVRAGVVGAGASAGRHAVRPQGVFRVLGFQGFRILGL